MIFSIAMMNSLDGASKLSLLALTAINEDEAIGQAVKWNETKYSPEAGWVLNKTLCIHIPLMTEMDEEEIKEDIEETGSYGEGGVSINTCKLSNK